MSDEVVDTHILSQSVRAPALAALKADAAKSAQLAAQRTAANARRLEGTYFTGGTAKTCFDETVTVGGFTVHLSKDPPCERFMEPERLTGEQQQTGAAAERRA